MYQIMISKSLSITKVLDDNVENNRIISCSWMYRCECFRNHMLLLPIVISLYVIDLVYCYCKHLCKGILLIVSFLQNSWHFIGTNDNMGLILSLIIGAL